jgi:Ni,Fe-hydrogenase III component G
MNTLNYLERAETLLTPWLDGATRPQENRLDLTIPVDALLPAVTALVEARWGYLAAITGLDPGVDGGELWVLYHFAEGAAVVTLRVTLPREHAIVPTIRELISLAGIYEQELSEVLGVTIAGAPAGGRLFLPDDWPDNVYPLRKDFQPA